MFGGWCKMCGVCVYNFLKLLKCEKYISEKTVLVLSKTHYSTEVVIELLVAVTRKYYYWTLGSLSQ